MIIYRLFLLAVLALGASAKNSKAHAHAKENSSRKLRASSRAESWSFSSGLPSWFSISPSSSGQGASTATVDQGLAGSSTTSQTTSPAFYLDCICLTPNADTTASVLSEAFASGVTSAESRAASRAVALAGDKCCSALGRALANAASFAESQGQGNAFVTAASRSQAEASNMCGREAIANAISGSRAVNANGEATASASATGSQAETQTESTVGQALGRVRAASCDRNGLQTIADVISADTTGLLSVLSEAVEAAHLQALLVAEGPINVIAPVNTAFEDFFEEYDITFEDFLAETDFLKDLLRYHVVADGAVCVGEPAGTLPTALDGQSVVFDSISVTDGRRNVANVILSVPASNGRLIVVDRVMWTRDTESGASDLEILLQAFDIIDTSGNGRVTVDEMIEAAARRGVVLTDAALSQWIDEDIDETGDLNFAEFTNTIWIDDR